MANAKRDSNRIPVILGILDTDGSMPTRIKVNVSNSNSILADDDTTGSDNGNGNRDDNRVSVMFAASSADGTTPVALYVNSSNELLIDSA